MGVSREILASSNYVESYGYTFFVLQELEQTDWRQLHFTRGLESFLNKSSDILYIWGQAMHIFSKFLEYILQSN